MHRLFLLIPVLFILLAAPAGTLASPDVDFLRLCGKKTTVVREVLEALYEGADVQFANRDGQTALMMAAGANENAGVVAALLHEGANVHAEDKRGQTALMYAAAKNKNVAVLNLLLLAGARVSDSDRNGRTPLMLAAATNTNPEILKTLILAGADAATGPKGFTPLMAAAKSNPSPEVIQVLLAAEKSELKPEETPENAAAEENSEEPKGKYELSAQDTGLLAENMGKHERGADAKLPVVAGEEQNGTRAREEDKTTRKKKKKKRMKKSLATLQIGSPLLLAVANNSNAEVAGTLIAAGYNDVSERDKEGLTLLHLAARNADPALIRILVEAGAEVDARAGELDFTPLLLAASPLPFRGPDLENPALFTSLIEAGAQVNTQDKNGMTPLMWAASCKENPEIIRTLLQAGAEVTARDKKGKTALDYAKKNQQPEIAHILEAVKGKASPSL